MQSDSSIPDLTHNSFVGSDPVPIPIEERLSNRFLYTCQKTIKHEPLVVRVGDPVNVSQSQLSRTGDNYDYGYSVKGVFDSGRKTDDDWSLRRFETVVSLHVILSNKMVKLNKTI